MVYSERYALRDGRLAGTMAYREYESVAGARVGSIVDLLVENRDENVLRGLIKAAVSDLESRGVDYLRVSVAPRWARRACRKNGFVDPCRAPFSGNIGPILMVRRSDSVADESLYDLERWWLTRGDSEQDLLDSAIGSLWATQRKG
jgi:hypothetical protein